MKRKVKPQLDFDSAVDLAGKIESEGDLLYTIRNWDFKEFRDKKFNSLRKALIKAAQDLEDYCALERVEEESDVDADGYCNTCFKVAANCICEETCTRCGDALDHNGECATCTGD